MTTLRQAAQQALEALEDHAQQYPHMQKGYTVDAITSLRDALAQEEQEAVADVEYYGLDPWEVSQFVPFATAIYPAHSPTKPFLAFGDCAHLYQDAIRCVPLYTRPTRREWQRLTNEEMFGLYRRAGLEAYYPRDGVVQGDYDRRIEAYARAIEAKIKEKNA